MRYAARWVTAVALVVGLGGLTAMAQRQGGGFGMFGGGGPAALVNSKTVQADLKVTDEQKDKLKDWAKEYATKQREKMQEAFKDFQSLSQEERRKKGAEFQAENTKTAYKELAEILKPEQIKRLKQIDLQVAGTTAYMRPDVQEALKFTDEQKDKLKDIGANAGKEMRDLREEYGIKGFGGPKLDPDKQKEYEKKLAAITKESSEKVTAVLTDDQKKTWKELTGAPVDVAKIQQDIRAQFGGFRPKKKDD